MDLKSFEKHTIPMIEAGRAIEKVRNTIKNIQYAEQYRREGLKETFKPITDELEKVDEGIDELRDELKYLKASEGPPALPAIEGLQQVAAITHDDYMTKEEHESVLNRGYPDIAMMIDNPDLKEKTLQRLSKDSKSLGGQNRSAHGQRKTEIEKQLRANTNYRRLIKGLPNPQKGSSIFYYNNPRDLFERLDLLGGSIMAGNNSAKNEFSEVAHTLFKIGLLSSEVLNSLLKKIIEIK